AKTTNGGYNWESSSAGLSSDGNFIAPFVISPSNPDIMYAGARDVYRSEDAGMSWFSSSGFGALNNTSIATIGVSYQSADTLMVGTGGRTFGGVVTYQIFSSTTGGQIWTDVSGSLPRRYPTDISFDPNSSGTVYVSFSGYDTTHIYKTTNLGQTWRDIS